MGIKNLSNRKSKKNKLFLIGVIFVAIALVFTFFSVRSKASTKMMIPTINNLSIFKDKFVSIDISNINEGYLAIRYNGNKSFAKLQIYKNEYSVYTYDLKKGKGFEYFPLTDGNGEYRVVVYEPETSGNYTPVFSTYVNVNLRNNDLPFLYPSQYVNFSSSSQLVSIANSLSSSCKSEAEIINSIFSYVSSNISYDYNKYSQLSNCYVPSPDTILSNGQGICFDFAAVMTAMLRSQGIPAKLEMGSVSTGEYHAWVKVYSNSPQQVEKAVSTNNNWCLLDPTFAATNSTLGANSYFTEFVY